MQQLAREGELRKIKASVDPEHEIGAVCKILNERRGSPAVLFENVKGSAIPVVGQLLASNKRVAYGPPWGWPIRRSPNCVQAERI